MKPGLNKGQLIKWKDDQGFGFIKPSEGGKDVFLHITAVKTTGRRPKNGDTIFYELTTRADGKICAFGASIQGVVSHHPTAQNIKPVLALSEATVLGLLAAIFGVGMAATVVLFQMQSRPNRFPLPSTASTTSMPIPTVPLANCVIKGNISINTGAKLYHVPGMKDYERTIIRPEYGERWFCSESEAIAAGWSRAPR